MAQHAVHLTCKQVPATCDLTSPVSSSLKSRLPLMASDATQALKRPSLKEGTGSQGQKVAVHASALDSRTKNLQSRKFQVTKTEFVSLRSTLVIRKKAALNYLTNIVADLKDDGEDLALNRKVFLQLVSADQVDPGTLTGKLSDETSVENWFLSQDKLKETDISYPVTIKVPKDFGTPGALLVRNNHSNEFFLKSFTVKLPDGNEVYFACNSWVYNVDKYKSDRIFFSNQVYLPNQTPPGLVQKREAEKSNLRGDGEGERQAWDRIYDYAVYNDLGDASNPKLKRPSLGGSVDFPYPRRIRTGRKAAAADPTTEERGNSSFYIPRDEVFDGTKEADFLSVALISVGHLLVPAIDGLLSDDKNEFRSFKDVQNLYDEGIDLKEQLQVQKSAMSTESKQIYLDPFQLVKGLGADDRDSVIKYIPPQVLQVDQNAWMDDEEFGRQTLSGVNPLQIERLTAFPPVSSLNVQDKYGDPTSAITAQHIEPYLEGLTVQQALDETRLYTLDYYDYFLPYIERINESSDFEPSKGYATRTILFLTSRGNMKPVAIELGLPGNTPSSKRVFTPPKDGNRDWLWELAKGHARANDCAFHEIYSHWARAHATMEPIIIATQRQLSVLHPVHLLLLPHFKNTMNINEAARKALINAGGIIERCFTPGNYSMEMSSVLYGALWQFDEQGLPNDLLKRGMAERDQNAESGVKLVFEDYPYGLDGLDIWSALKSWVQDYVDIYYVDDKTVQEDAEVRDWWSEIRTEGHGDKKDATGWPTLNSKENLVQILTTIAWVASAHHAAVNFGQYAYTGYMPNHTSTMRRLIPEENSEDYKELLSDPEKFFLESHAKPSQATIVMSTIEILATHASNEEYLGQQSVENWTSNEEVLNAFQRYGERLQQIQKTIDDRNLNNKLTNRLGPAKIPYTLLYPTSEPGLTGKGIPNSVSI